ncbi:uncharacterized protein LOC125179516 [Hyalella azteca]|uniref:Uncharacterized protein LOC125179516 n=1 Tax=Hyalella azteca TaxID=294128 RepID=A0A979FW76_HYAAZ|nr:uncharacterized protein LOC125179516 [Hyalella azteca]
MSDEGEGGVAWQRVWTVEGGRAELACPVRPRTPGDAPSLVLWYKGNSTTPVYSYDARQGRNFGEGMRWVDETVLGLRAYFLPTRSASHAPVSGRSYRDAKINAYGNERLTQGDSGGSFSDMKNFKTFSLHPSHRGDERQSPRSVPRNNGLYEHGREHFIGMGEHGREHSVEMGPNFANHSWTISDHNAKLKRKLVITRASFPPVTEGSVDPSLRPRHAPVSGRSYRDTKINAYGNERLTQGDSGGSFSDMKNFKTFSLHPSPGGDERQSPRSVTRNNSLYEHGREHSVEMGPKFANRSWTRSDHKAELKRKLAITRASFPPVTEGGVGPSLRPRRRRNTSKDLLANGWAAATHVLSSPKKITANRALPTSTQTEATSPHSLPLESSDSQAAFPIPSIPLESIKPTPISPTRPSSVEPKVFTRPNGVAGRRARHAAGADPALSLMPVAQEDHGLYRCRLDYWESPTTMSYTQDAPSSHNDLRNHGKKTHPLSPKVLRHYGSKTPIKRLQEDQFRVAFPSVSLSPPLPPEELVILHDGARLHKGLDGVAWVTPVKEGTKINLSCRVAGGRPSPTITWWRGETQIPAKTSLNEVRPRYKRSPNAEYWDSFEDVDFSTEADPISDLLLLREAQVSRRTKHDSSGEHTSSILYGKYPWRGAQFDLPKIRNSDVLSRLRRNTKDSTRWWDDIEVPDSDSSSFNYTNFILGNVRYTDQYADQYGPYDPTRFIEPTTVDKNEPTAEPVQTKPAVRSEVADIIESTHYDKEIIVQSDISLIAMRDLVGTSLYCRAEQRLQGGPTDLLKPLMASVSLNITLGLLELEMEGGTQPVSAGNSVRVECRAYGSNPPAEISWWKAGTPIPSSVTAIMKGGNLTTSAVVLEVSAKDNGSNLICTATNPVLRSSHMTKRRTLKVFFPPEVEIQMSEPALISTVTEGADLVMICHAHSNPPPHDYRFYHKGMELHPANGISVSDTTLTIRRVHRDQAGAYTCKATNLEGATLSPALHLTVLFAPVCAPGWGARTQGAALGATEAIACRVDAAPDSDLQFT